MLHDDDDDDDGGYCGTTVSLYLALLCTYSYLFLYDSPEGFAFNSPFTPSRSFNEYCVVVGV